MAVEIAGLGNAIMDALVRIDDDQVLTELGLQRGQMQPVDHSGWHFAYDRVHALGVDVYSGGSCDNVVATAGLLGSDALFLGQVGDDRFGALYGRSLEAACGRHALHVAPGAVTGKCLSLISRKDAERTMLTDLGTSVELRDLGNFADVIRNARVLHIEGYGFLGGPVKEAVKEGIAIARAAGVPVSLDIADPFVARILGDELRSVLKSGVHIGFFNREEAEILTGKGAYAALEELASWVEIAVVKLGAEGSLVRRGAEIHKIPAFPTAVTDTTGAGDSYAGAFLHAWVRGAPLDRCGGLASRVAALVVGQVGAVCRDRDALRRASVEAGAGTDAEARA